MHKFNSINNKLSLLIIEFSYTIINNPIPQPKRMCKSSSKLSEGIGLLGSISFLYTILNKLLYYFILNKNLYLYLKLYY